MNFLPAFLALNRAVQAKGFPEVSQFWVETITRFITSGKRQLVGRIGRRGGKSSTLCRFAVAFALAYNTKLIPPGDVGVVAFVSVNVKEAKARLRTIKALLDAIKVKWKPVEDGIELVGRPLVFMTFAATIGAVSGFTSILVVADEVAKWADKETGTNPATEVLAALRPTMSTQREGKIVLISSAMGLRDAHAEAFDKGETEHQAIALASTWEANPTLSVAWTHADEPHEPIWRREYACIPSGGANCAFLPEDIEASVRPIEGLTFISKPVLLLDSSAGSGDAWTWAACAWCRPQCVDEAEQWMWEPITQDWKPGLIASAPNGQIMRQVLDNRGVPVPNPEFEHKTRPVLVVYKMGAIEGRFRGQVSADEAVARAMAVAKSVGATQVIGDQYQSFFLESACKKHDVTYKQVTWSNPTKMAAVATLRRLMRAQRIFIEPGYEGEAIKKELLGFEEKLSPNGVMTFGARRGGHDDRVALLINAAIAESQHLLGGSPNGRSRRRFEVHDHVVDEGEE